MNENSEKLQEKTLKLERYLRERGDMLDHIKYGVAYFITSKDSRNSELSELLSKYVDLHTLKGRKVLDIGCGTGSFSAFLQEKGIDTYGIDVDTELVHIAFTKNVLVSNAHALPFKDETFDVVVAIDVIEHLQNQKTAIQNMLSKTKPRGKVILLTNNRLFPFDTDTKLFFINYLPKSLATKYLRFRRKTPTIEYDNKNPTYFSFAKLCNRRLEHKIEVKGVFTIFGYYVEKYKKLKKIAAIIENVSYRSKLLRWMQWFAPKLCLIIEKSRNYNN